jgi:NAD-dependent dihydropyrimidine dehydrogenase PreA subunit
LELAVAYVITAGCIDVLDKTCIDECPVDCIYVGERMLYIHPDECVDCGACEPVCPQEAIYHEEDVPENMSGFVAGNRDFFAELGNPGGASGLSQPGRDVPLVANWPVSDRA